MPACWSGVTRGFVLELAARLDLRAEECVLREDDLPSMQEAFLTSTTREIVPVVRIGTHTIGDGTPGPVTRRLMAAFTAAVPDGWAALDLEPSPTRPAPALSACPDRLDADRFFAYSVIGGHAQTR